MSSVYLQQSKHNIATRNTVSQTHHSQKLPNTKRSIHNTTRHQGHKTPQ